MLGLTAILTARQPKPTAASTALSQGEAPDSENESVGGRASPYPPIPSWFAGAVCGHYLHGCTGD